MLCPSVFCLCAVGSAIAAWLLVVFYGTGFPLLCLLLLRRAFGPGKGHQHRAERLQW